MKTLRNHILFVFFFVCIGCTLPPIYRTDVLLMDIRSTNCSPSDKYLTYENDTIRVVYIFWAEKGKLNMIIHNKLAKPIYIDWKKCSFITDSTKHDYWQGTTTMVTNGDSYTDYFYRLYSNSLHTSYSFVTRIEKPERITFMPPGITISVGLFTLYGNDRINIPTNQFLSKDTTVAAKSQVVKVTRSYPLRPDHTYQEDSLVVGPVILNLSYVNFDSDKSPFSFRSFITYSTDDKFTKEAFIDNYFYLARLTQMSTSVFNLNAPVDSMSQDNRSIWADSRSFYVFRSVKVTQQ